MAFTLKSNYFIINISKNVIIWKENFNAYTTKKIDFKDKSKLNAAREWGKNEEYKWKKNLNLQQQKSVEKLKHEYNKIKIYDYSKSMTFFLMLYQN